ncbi:DENN domain, partial [Trinorchestia longiramus]
YPLRELFSVLSPECVVQLLSCMLLENQVLLVSADYYRLMLVAECMYALVLPFTWHHVYVWQSHYPPEESPHLVRCDSSYTIHLKRAFTSSANLKLWLVKSAQLDKTNESTSSSCPPPASSSSPPD